MQKIWSKQEWSFCLHCFSTSLTWKEAVLKFNTKFNRTKKAIKRRFERMGMRGGAVLNTKTNKPQMQDELVRVWKLYGHPYTEEEFDEVSNIKSELIIQAFGSWETALERANLTKKFNKHTQVTNEIKNFSPERELKKRWENEKGQILYQAEKRKIKEIKQQAQKLDIINEMLLSATEKVAPIVVHVHTVEKFPNLKHTKNCTLWFEFSDLQLGTLITSEEMQGINEHNWDIWQEKLNVWTNTVIDKIYLYKQNYQIDRVIIGCLGDMVEGIDIFKGQMWKVENHVVDQAINGANDVAAAFASIFLTHHDIQFDVLEVFGNHGRLGQKGEHPYSCSMDKVFQRMLESQIHKININNYTYHRNEAWFYFIEIYGWNHLLLHGDQGMSKLWSSRPTINGLEKGLSRWNQMLQQQIHFIHCGHFHNDVSWAFNMSQILINGSFIGTSPFSATAMLASSPPIQVMHVFEERVGLSKTERIYLLEGDVRRVINPKKFEN